MEIKCHDKYKDEDLIIRFPDDKIYVDSYSSNYAHANIRVEFEAVTGEDPSPERFSDLENFEIVK